MECEICGNECEIRYDNQYKLLRKHESCMKATKRIQQIKKAIQDLEQKLLNEEFNLFCARFKYRN